MLYFCCKWYALLSGVWAARNGLPPEWRTRQVAKAVLKWYITPLIEDLNRPYPFRFDPPEPRS